MLVEDPSEAGLPLLPSAGGEVSSGAGLPLLPSVGSKVFGNPVSTLLLPGVRTPIVATPSDPRTLM